MERSGNAQFNNIGQILSSGFYNAKTVEDVKDLIDKYLSGEIISLKEKQIENIEKLFPTRNSAANIANDIISSLTRL
jgi:hypothetical protein